MNLMDIGLDKLGLGLQPLSATTVDGKLLCKVTHQSSPVTLRFPDGHSENLAFHLYHQSRGVKDCFPESPFPVVPRVEHPQTKVRNQI